MVNKKAEMMNFVDTGTELEKIEWSNQTQKDKGHILSSELPAPNHQ